MPKLVTNIGKKIPSDIALKTLNNESLFGIGNINISGGSGSGDMTKAVYDTDNDGKVNEAESVEWSGVQNKPSTFTPATHMHSEADITNLTSDLGALATAIVGKEPANVNIQSHIGSTHAPSNAQKNSDIIKAEIEAVLTGLITSHSHAGGGSVNIKQTEVNFGTVPVSDKKFTITDAEITPSMKIIAVVSYDNPTGGFDDDAEWFENVIIMARAGTGQVFLYCKSPYADLDGLMKVNYINA